MRTALLQEGCVDHLARPFTGYSLQAGTSIIQGLNELLTMSCSWPALTKS